MAETFREALALMPKNLDYDHIDSSILLEHSISTSGSGSGSDISEDMGSPADRASVLISSQNLSFEQRTADANILSIETSSEDDDEEYLEDDLAQSFEDQAFAKNSTPLYEALRRREWRQAKVFLQNGSYMSRSLVDGSLLSEPRVVPPEEQVRTWVSMYETDGRLVWRRLPIHDALCRGAPASLIHTMLHHHPMSVEAKDWDGNLPLHLAMMHNADRTVVEMLLKEYPSAIEVRNDKGKLPLECVTMKGRESGMWGEVLQRYVSSAKQVATQEVPKLKGKLFEVNKTIEAAKQELRLAKVELGMIKQQEKMRIQNKEKEESRMREEVLRLRSELNLLRSEREDVSEEREHWALAAKKGQKVLAVSDSDDSDDSQRSWIEKEFSQMVSELEKTTLGTKHRKPNLNSRRGNTSPIKLYYPSTFHSRDGGIANKSDNPNTLGNDYVLKRSDTAVTETSLDWVEQLEQASCAKASSKDSNSIRSIREEVEEHSRNENEARQKRLDSSSDSDDGESLGQSGPKKLGSRSSSLDIEEKLNEQIRRLESRSASEDRGEALQERIEKLESRSDNQDSDEGASQATEDGSCNSEECRESGDKLAKLDEKLTDVLRAEGHPIDKKIDVLEEAEALETSSKESVSSISTSDHPKPDSVDKKDNRGAQGDEVVRVNSSESKSDSIVSKKSDSIVSKSDSIGSKSNSIISKSNSIISKSNSTISKSNSIISNSNNIGSKPSISVSATGRPRGFYTGVALADSKDSSVASSMSGKASSRSSSSSTKKSELEIGLAKVAKKTSSNARWNCNSMADDLTCHDEEEAEEQKANPVVGAESSPSRAIPIAEAEVFEETRDRQTRSTRRSGRQGQVVTLLLRMLYSRTKPETVFQRNSDALMIGSTKP